MGEVARHPGLDGRDAAALAAADPHGAVAANGTAVPGSRLSNPATGLSNHSLDFARPLDGLRSEVALARDLVPWADESITQKGRDERHPKPTAATSPPTVIGELKHSGEHAIVPRCPFCMGKHIARPEPGLQRTNCHTWHSKAKIGYVVVFDPSDHDARRRR